jgi:RHS repeat-associated protein
VGSVKSDRRTIANPGRFVGKTPVWPSHAAAVVDLAAVGGGRHGQARVSGLPVAVTVGAASDVSSARALADAAAGRGMPTKVKVEVFDRGPAVKAGAEVVLRLSRADGVSGGFHAHAEFGYGAFADAFGGDWAQRLRVVGLPGCAVSTPAVDVCRLSTPLTSDVDLATQTVSADVYVPAVGETASGTPLRMDQPAPGPSPAPSAEPLPSASPAPSQAVAPSGPVPVGSPSPSSSQSSVPDGVSDGSMVVALAAGTSSETGDFSRTNLAQSASWQAGGSAGAFSWSYPIEVPPVPGGLTPPVSVGYSSAAVDGQTANDNVQPGWLGEGFSLDPGFIERRYRPCALDTTIAPTWVDGADQCWRMANATLSWGGHAGELIPDDATDPPNTVMPTSWHLADDDGTKVEYLSDGGSSITLNWHNEHWRLTTKDGTQYWFGLSYVPGTTTRTNSVQGEPVVSNHPGEPCFDSAGLSTSWCTMAYRWNLDYVVDPHGNSMVYTYAKENNFAHKPGFATATQGYDRANYLSKIEYGWRAGQEATTAAPARVLFTTANRCWTSSCGTHDGSNWPDVPWDLDCASGGPCDAPTFWTTRRLTQIDAQVWTGSGTTYRSVDSYVFDSTVFGTGHTGYSGVLNLSSIARTGADSGTGVTGANVSLAPVYFGYGAAMQNRALFDPASGAAEAWKFRVRQVTSETGAETTVNYAPVDGGCVYPSTPPNPDTNYRRCLPQPYGGGWTWWHKYVVSSVVEHDGTGASAADITHAYTYATSASVAGKTVGTSSVLWHHDTNPFAFDLPWRSWSQWAGYPVVTEVTGTGTGSSQSKTMSLYWTGLEGDRTDAGDGTRHVSLIDTESDTDGDHRDYLYRAGQLREEITFDGNTTTVLSKTLTDSSAIQTGERTISATWASSYIPRAYIPITTAERGYTWVAATSTWRQTKTAYGYDGLGNQTSEDDQGDVSTAADDVCTTSTYLANTAENLRRYDGTGPGALAATPKILDTDWSGSNLTVSAGDFTGDGKKDLITRTASGRIYSNAGTGSGTFNAGTLISTGFGAFRSLAVADFTGDNKPDIVGNLPDDRLLLYPGTGTGGIGAAIQIGNSGWAPYDLSAPGDLTGDGKPDLVGRRSYDGKLYLWPGNGAGGLNTAQLIGASGWDVYWQVSGSGDYTGDGKADILAADAGGVWVYPGTATSTGALGGRTRLAAGVIGPDTDWYIPTGDITGDAKPDLLTRQLRYLAGLPSTAHTVGKACGAAVTYPQDALADARSYYDQPGVSTPTLTQTPLLGDATASEQASSYTGSTPNWVTTAQVTAFDAYGRPTTVKDGLGRTTTTTYTHTNGLTSSVTVTPPLGSAYSSTTSLAVGRGLPVTATDPNGKVTTGAYDALGRLIKVWLPGQPTNGTANQEYTYSISASTPSSVQSKVLGPNGNQISSFDIYDGLLRPRQTQTTAPDGKRAIADTQYDARGLAVKSSTFYNNASAPSGTLASFADTSVATQQRLTYDGVERPTVDALWSLGALKWQTTTSYDGDRVTVDPPDGATPTTTIPDAGGRTTALRQYKGSSPTGAYDEIQYAYDRLDRLTGMTDAAGNSWSYGYDLLGRQTSRTDPDAGTSTSTYDNAGQLTTTTDGRGEVLARVYDDLGRLTELHDDTTSGPLRASYVYDTLAKGQLTSSTRHVGANAYTTTVTGYTDQYAPTGTTVTIPAAEGALAGTYTTSATYNVDGSTATTTPVTAGGLPAETLTYGYNNAGLPTTLTGATSYVASTDYAWDATVSRRLLGTAGKQVRLTDTRDDSTRRLTTRQVDTENQTTPGTFNDKSTTEYGYDQAGNVTAVAGKTNGTRDQVECFRYDYLRRLTDAWTEATWTCQTPQRAGADPYRLSWTYDTTGNRSTQTTSSATGTTTATSSYPAAGGAKPHQLTQVAYTGETTRTDSYDYDNAGNTTTRTVNGTTQTLTWDAEGHLATTTENGQNTSYVYDPAGNRLLRRDSGGTTLYLGDTELHLTTGGQVDGTRYYQHGDAVAVRTTTGLTWMAADHHGTDQLAIDPTNLTVTRRRTMPFGEPRGIQPTGWPGDKGFVGGTQDQNGLTHLGAREYDPITGRFLSVDPVMDAANPQQWNAYAYASNSPATLSDPSGLIPSDCLEFDCYGYDPRPVKRGDGRGAGGCPGGCGTKKNIDWGHKKNRGSTRSKKTSGHAVKNKKKSSPVLLGLLGGDGEDESRPGGVPVYEAEWCGIYGGQSCELAYLLSRVAIKRADDLKDELKWVNGERNAFRHSYWMALMTASGFTVEQALGFGEAHELDGDKPGQEWGSEDSRADLHNNKVGARLGAKLFRSDWIYLPAGAPKATREKIETRLLSMLDGYDPRTGPYTRTTRDGKLRMVPPPQKR